MAQIISLQQIIDLCADFDRVRIVTKPEGRILVQLPDQRRAKAQQDQLFQRLRAAGDPQVWSDGYPWIGPESSHPRGVLIDPSLGALEWQDRRCADLIAQGAEDALPWAIEVRVAAYESRGLEAPPLVR